MDYGEDVYSGRDAFGLLGSTSFAIKGLTQAQIIEALDIADVHYYPFLIANVEYSDFCMDFMPSQEDKAKTETRCLFSQPIEDWIYMYWSWGAFEHEMEVIEKLNEAGAKCANAYYVDGHVASSSWILSKDGAIYRAFYQSHHQVLFNQGDLVTQKETELLQYLRAPDSNEFVFDEEVLTSIEKVSGKHSNRVRQNAQLIEEMDFSLGTIWLDLDEV